MPIRLDGHFAMLKKAKDRLVNGLIGCAVIGVAGSIIIWLIRFYFLALSVPTTFISEQFALNWWGSFLIMSLALIVFAYLIGNYSLIDLIKWRSKNKLVKRELFSIRLKTARAVGFAEELDGHIEGYVTRNYITKNGIRYNASLFISGWTVVSRLREEEFVRTNKTVAQLVAYYGSAGREYVDDDETFAAP